MVKLNLNCIGKKGPNLMFKRLVYSLPLVAVILLSACSGQATATPTAAPTAVPTIVLPTAAASQDNSAAPTPAAAPTLPVTTGPATCKVVDSLLPVIPADAKPSIPPVDEKKDWVRGSADAPVTIIEYSDYQCPYCEQMSAGLDNFVKEQGKNVRFVYRHFPLSQHEKAPMAAQAAEAAGLQGKFWEMHDFLFAKANWDLWTPMTLEAFQTYLKEKAGPAIQGLDAAKFATDLTSDVIVTKVKDAQKEADTLGQDQKNGIQGTPTFYIFTKSQIYNAPPSVVLFANIINLVKQDDQRYKECPPMTVDPKKQYSATLKTAKGDIVVKLYPDKAQAAVNSFIFLANKGYYNNVSFHRVVPNFIAQTGDPSNSGMGGPGYTLGTEITRDMAFDREGLVGMIRSSEPDTNNSQFFITLGALPNLDQRYTLFGEVTSGMDVVKKLTLRDINSDANPAPGDIITSVTIEEK
jgi:cyclophilin family peptidyl-prolyl cis-trans isomerase/protein-disulfide isomerase